MLSSGRIAQFYEMSYNELLFLVNGVEEGVEKRVMKGVENGVENGWRMRWRMGWRRGGGRGTGGGGEWWRRLWIPRGDQDRS